jgi:hypothetical protein
MATSSWSYIGVCDTTENGTMGPRRLGSARILRELAWLLAVGASNTSNMDNFVIISFAVS